MFVVLLQQKLTICARFTVRDTFLETIVIEKSQICIGTTMLSVLLPALEAILLFPVVGHYRNYLLTFFLQR